MKRMISVLLGLAVASPALATGIDEACQDVTRPDDYNEQRQQDFLMNYYALNASFSGVHGPIPHKQGRGSLGVQLNGLMPLPCVRRFALDFTKTEDTNKSPVLPTLMASYAFNSPVEKLTPYAEAAFLAPIPIAGTRNLVFQAALGVGYELSDKVSIGGRAHASVQRTIGDIATPLAEGDPVYEDLFLGSTLGIQMLGGYDLSEALNSEEDTVGIHVMFGLIDASTFFYVADSGIVTNNLHPYLGPEYAVGTSFLLKDRIRVGVEYYGAPGGRRIIGEADTLDGFAAYGRVHTARARVALEL